LNDSEAETLRRFQAGESIDQIARRRGFVGRTIQDHLVKAIEAGAPLAMEQFFTSAQAEELGGAVSHIGPRGLTGLGEELGGKYEIAELRLFRALAARERRSA
jgi:hypothetical protein